MGARQIIALNLMDFRDVLVEAEGFGPFLGKLFHIVERRQHDLEMSLAEARGVKVHRLDLLSTTHVQLWQFEHTEELIQVGYQAAKKELEEGDLSTLRGGWGWFDRAVSVIRERLGLE